MHHIHICSANANHPRSSPGAAIRPAALFLAASMPGGSGGDARRGPIISISRATAERIAPRR